MDDESSKRFFEQKPLDDNLLFQTNQTYQSHILSVDEKRLRLEEIFERALHEFKNTDVPALVSDALADFHIFNDNPLDAIVVLEKGLKTVNQHADDSRYFLYNHLAILCTPPGEIVLSRTSAEYLDIHRCQSLGKFSLKGVTELQELFQVGIKEPILKLKA